MSDNIKCDMCGNSTELIVGNYEWHNEYLGDLSISHAEYYRCESCSNTIIPFETAIRIDKEEHNTLQNWLWKQCGDASGFNKKFLSNRKVVAYLGVSRAAINKSLKYKGLIYHVVIDGLTYCFAESVKLFKRKGDGRFPIYNETVGEKPTSNGFKFINPDDEIIKYNVEEEELAQK